jgi:3-methyladenine DNA glycosylase AlkD
MTVNPIEQHLRSLASPEAAALCARYFKTGPGEYAEGDQFLGLRAATMHELAKMYRALPVAEATELLSSPVHELRMLALLVWVRQVAKADDACRKRIFDLYLAHTRFVNNWDLVDASAPALVGAYLLERSRRPLYRLAKSKLLWERRIAIVATLAFIRGGDFTDTLGIAGILLKEREDLIHKATGWMLREVGKRDEAALEGFLTKHAAGMPRTLLRYAIERFSPEKRKQYLRAGKV